MFLGALLAGCSARVAELTPDNAAPVGTSNAALVSTIANKIPKTNLKEVAEADDENDENDDVTETAPEFDQATGSDGVTSISAGTYGSCATARGSAYCWGYVSLVAGPGIHPTPLQVPGSLHMKKISEGTSHYCAVREHSVYCWGVNFTGQIGDGTTNPSDVPVRVLNGASAVGTGSDYSCALKNQKVHCWGANTSGMLGNNSTTPSLVPVKVLGLDNIKALAVGGSHSCAIGKRGKIYCWGENSFGQLGNDHIECESTFPGLQCYTAAPVEVKGIEGATALAVGSIHTCAVVEGAVYCWGYNAVGQLGDGTHVDAHVAVKVQGLVGPVRAIAAGFEHTCALTDDGVWCWGTNESGELGDGSILDSAFPVAVQGLPSPVSAFDAGDQHTCAIVSGNAFCWGRNQNSQLGNGSDQNALTPTRVQF